MQSHIEDGDEIRFTVSAGRIGCANLGPIH
jgi:hypothetical protein